MTVPTAVLLLAYGTPDTPADIEPYFRHIRGGREPAAAAVEDLRRRYEAVGGRTPLLDISDATARSLQLALERRTPGAYRTFLAMKHWHPFIGEVVPRIAAEGIRRIIALVLAPHYSRLSVGGYRKYLDEANAALPVPLDISFVESWHLHPAFVELVADRIAQGLAAFAPREPDEVCVLFSAHSLPVRIRTWNDPYEAQMAASCLAVARAARVRRWRFAWQSAGNTGEPWLGPDILEYLEMLHREGIADVLSVPIGFVSEHLEVLYDIDQEAARRAAVLGMSLQRAQMPNASAELVAVLEALVREVDRATGAVPAA